MLYISYCEVNSQWILQFVLFVSIYSYDFESRVLLAVSMSLFISLIHGYIWSLTRRFFLHIVKTSFVVCEEDSFIFSTFLRYSILKLIYSTFIVLALRMIKSLYQNIIINLWTLIDSTWLQRSKSTSHIYRNTLKRIVILQHEFKKKFEIIFLTWIIKCKMSNISSIDSTRVSKESLKEIKSRFLISFNQWKNIDLNCLLKS